MKVCRCVKPTPLFRPSGDQICAMCGDRVMPAPEPPVARAHPNAATEIAYMHKHFSPQEITGSSTFGRRWLHD